MNDKLKSLLQETLNLTEAEFSPSLTREQISSWDSLKHMDLVVALENAFDTQLEMMEIIGLDSIPAIEKTLKEKGVL